MGCWGLRAYQGLEFRGFRFRVQGVKGLGLGFDNHFFLDLLSVLQLGFIIHNS